MKVNLVSLIKIKVSLLKQLVGVELRIAIEVLRNLINFKSLGGQDKGELIEYR